MKNPKLHWVIIAGAAAWATQAYSQNIVTSTFDENGNGHYTINGANPTPLMSYDGPLNNNVLTYYFPTTIAWNPGAVVMTDGTGNSDLLVFQSGVQWNSSTYDTVTFYSADVHGGALADVGLPAIPAGATYIAENENGFTSYIPTSAEPGYLNSSAFSTSFAIYSAVPEPARIGSLAGVAALGLLCVGMRKKHSVAS